MSSIARLRDVVDHATQDLRYAWRGFRRSPVFIVTTVASLSLAIAATTAIYAIVDAAIFRSLSVPRPHELIVLGSTEVDASAQLPGETFSYPAYEQLDLAARGTARLALVE